MTSVNETFSSIGDDVLFTLGTRDGCLKFGNIIIIMRASWGEVKWKIGKNHMRECVLPLSSEWVENTFCSWLWNFLFDIFLLYYFHVLCEYVKMLRCICWHVRVFNREKKFGFHLFRHRGICFPFSICCLSEMCEINGFWLFTRWQFNWKYGSAKVLNFQLNFQLEPCNNKTKLN